MLPDNVRYAFEGIEVYKGYPWSVARHMFQNFPYHEIGSTKYIYLDTLDQNIFPVLRFKDDKLIDIEYNMKTTRMYLDEYK